ncbi:MAG TPA: hypothetical protein VLL97_13855, partial [Acidobacteriota bacterium]|nr:hypothetical protein [Acidobacteriota bacterium]
MEKAKRPQSAAVRLVFLIFILQQAHAASMETAPLPSLPEIQARISANPATATVGDPIHLTLDLFVPERYRAEIREIAGQEGIFEIMEWRRESPEPPGMAELE